MITPERRVQLDEEKNFSFSVLELMEDGFAQDEAIRRTLNRRRISLREARNLWFRRAPNLLKQYQERYRREQAKAKERERARRDTEAALAEADYEHWQRAVQANEHVCPVD